MKRGVTFLPHDVFCCRELAKEMHVPWSEYWDFLDASVNLDTEEGLQKLEDHLSHKKDALLAEISLRRQADYELHKDLSICDMLERLRLSDSENLLRNLSLEANSGVRQKQRTGNHLQVCVPRTKDEQSDGRGNDSQPVQTSHSRVSRVNDLRVDETEMTDGEACWDAAAAAANAAGEVEIDDWDAASFHTAVDDMDLEYSECSDVLDETWEVFLPHPIKVFFMG